jgi:N-acetylmuramoyl-L-alanine amidase
MLTHPSPHHNARKGPIRLIVLHATAGRSDLADVRWIGHPQSQVSYHVLIGRDGERYTCVAESRRAWHAGKSAWPGIADVNGASLGLAWCNRHDGTEPLTAAQIAEGKQVIREWVARYPTIEAIVTHKEIAPGRKTDPHDVLAWYRPDWTLDAIRART